MFSGVVKDLVLSLLLLNVAVLRSFVDSAQECNGGHCQKHTDEVDEEEDGPCIVEYEDMKELYRWDPVEVREL